MKDIILKRKLSYVSKAIVVISALLGTFLSAYAGRGSFMGGTRVFMYFTIQSNIGIAVICGIGFYLIKNQKEVSRLWYLIKFVGTVAITLTGVVFCFVLAPTLGEHAWNIQNILTHVVVPIVAVIDFFLISSTSNYKKKDVVYVTIPPIAYAIYAGIGFVNGWEFAEGINYPYFFLNWNSPAGAFGFTNELPFMGCAWWILVLLIFLMVVGYIYLAIVDRIKKNHKKGI